MKNLRDLLIVVAVGTTLFFPGRADAELFKRLKARRAARTATCVGPDCVQQVGPGGPGQLRINPNGGFEGRLPDSYYADYFAKQTATTPTVPAATVPVNDEAGSVAAALEGVKRAEANLAEAKAAAERAVLEQRRTAARQALELKQQIDQLRLDYQKQLDDLTARQKALEPDEM